MLRKSCVKRRVKVGQHDKKYKQGKNGRARRNREAAGNYDRTVQGADER
jgi:hypothetical protein